MNPAPVTYGQIEDTETPRICAIRTLRFTRTSDSFTIAAMPRFVIERSFAQISDEEFLAAGVRSDEAIRNAFPEITWEHSHVCADENGGITTFCVYEAPDEKTIGLMPTRSAATASRASTRCSRT